MSQAKNNKFVTMKRIICELESTNFAYYDFHEYKLITSASLRDLYYAKLIRQCESDNAEIIVTESKGTINGFAVIESEPFDSEIFGYAIYKCKTIITLSKELAHKQESLNKLISNIDEFIQRKHKRAYLLISLNNNNPDNILAMNIFMKHAYYYLHTLITFSFQKDEFNKLHFSGNNEVVIRPARAEDVDKIVWLASNSFHFSRFHLDPYLDKKKANELLGKSAYNSIIDHFVDIVFVAVLNDQVVGYYSAKKHYIPKLSLTYGEVVIVAVDQKVRGRGIFKALNREMISWFHTNTDFAEMGTYLGNIPVLRTWTKNGLSIVRGTHQLSKSL